MPSSGCLSKMGHDYANVQNLCRHEKTVSHKRNWDPEFTAAEQSARKAKISWATWCKESKESSWWTCKYSKERKQRKQPMKRRKRVSKKVSRKRRKRKKLPKRLQRMRKGLLTKQREGPRRKRWQMKKNKIKNKSSEGQSEANCACWKI